jgi:hypothetical protein
VLNNQFLSYMAKGGARPGAGRKSKADEIKYLEEMDKTMPVKDVFEKLAALVEGGDTNAIKIWLNYRLGLPKQTMELDHRGNVLLKFVKSQKCDPIGKVD